jgi:hypothetical protein
LALFIGSWPVLGQGAAQPPMTSAISGLVVDASSNTPIAGALVRLQIAGALGTIAASLTDAKGRFVFEEVPPKRRYHLTAAKQGFLSQEDATAEAGAFIDLAEGEWRSDVRLSMIRAGSLSGRVIDEQGEPLVGSVVRALSVLQIFGTRSVVSANAAVTDDLGAYRIADLPAGVFVVAVASTQLGTNDVPPLQSPAFTVSSPLPAATPATSGGSSAYAATYYPGVADIDAALKVDLAPGQRRSGVDIVLEQVPTFTVSGSVLGPADAIGGLRLRLVRVSDEGLGPGAETAVVTTQRDGHFVFPAAPSGEYVVESLPGAGRFTFPIRPFDQATGSVGVTGGIMRQEIFGRPAVRFETPLLPDASVPRYWVRSRVAVADANVANETVVMQATKTLSGTVVLDSASGASSLPIDPVRLLQLDPAETPARLGAPLAVPVGTDGAFVIQGVVPGPYFLRSSAASGAGWMVKAVIWNGQDYTNRVLDVTDTASPTGLKVILTAATSSLTGRIRDDGRGLEDVTVVLLPSAADRWTRIGLWPPDVRVIPSARTYEARGLPAGEYLALALRGRVTISDLDSNTLRRLAPLGTTVTLDWGHSRQLDLSAIDLPRKY